MLKQIYDEGLDAHFVTFACYRRRRLLDHDAARVIVVETLRNRLLKQQAQCYGFVVMPDHVHAVIWFPCAGKLSSFMQQWKQASSFHIQRLFRTALWKYSEMIGGEDPVWHKRYYDFNIFSQKKLREKLEYMHSNPVRAGLVRSAEEWPYSSAKFYETGESVGVPVVCPL